MSKIYSRFRINIPNFSKVNKLKFIILFLFTIIMISIVLFVLAAYPIFIVNCRNNAISIGVQIANLEVSKSVKKYSYNDLVLIEKDNDGNIKLVQAKILPINEIISEITSNVQNEINNVNKSKVYIDMGTVTGVGFLTNIGPSVNMDLKTIGNIKTNIMSKFESVGINQTLHKIYAALSIEISILTPFRVIR